MENIYLSETNIEAYIKPYILNVKELRPAIIVCPGGGYGRLSDREAEQVAMQFMAKGYHAFVLKYSVAPYKYPTQLVELAKAMKIVRDRAIDWNINKDKVTVIGFSAGGHLAASLAVHWDKQIIKEHLDIDNEYIRPNAVILSYPVITSGEFAHRGSFDNIIGQDKDLLEWVSLEKQVGAHVPPIFLWHTVTDASVPVENSMLFGMALRKYDVPFEMHIYDKGVHGLSLCNRLSHQDGEDHLEDAHVATWLSLAFEWLDRTYNKAI